MQVVDLDGNDIVFPNGTASPLKLTTTAEDKAEKSRRDHELRALFKAFNLNGNGESIHTEPPDV